MNIIIHPYEGIEIENKGIIRFGMTREEVRNFFNEQERKTYVKSEYAQMPTDAYYKSVLQFSYKKPGILQAILLTAGIGKVFFLDKDILNDCSYSEAFNWLNRADTNLEIDEKDDAISYKFGIVLGMSVENPVEDDYMIPESVVVFEKDYSL